MYKAIRDRRHNSKSVNFGGKTSIVDISSVFGPMSIKLGSLLEAVVLYRLSQQRSQSVTISGL
jgi:hypothetical protein